MLLIRTNMAMVYKKQGKYDEALAMEKTCRFIEEIRRRPSWCCTTYNNMANVYRKQGKYDEALAMYEKSLSIKLKKLGDDQAWCCMTYNNMAKNQGKYDEALAMNKKALRSG